MEPTRSAEAVRRALDAARGEGDRIGFVPTMGNLHDGHLALVRRSMAETDLTVVSIFVNPSQFEDGEDFQSYPRTLDEDLEKLARLDVGLVFVPEERTLYPAGPARVTRVEVPRLGELHCGRFRPHFFRGVCTVVNILFNIVRPHRAFFGRKDYQQLLIVERMVRDLQMPVEVVGVATVRERDGLAMSSRNVYLTAEQRRRAPSLYAALCEARERIREGDRDYRAVEARGMQRLAALGFRPEYLSVARARDLEAPSSDDADLVILAAAWLGEARLIDNVAVSEEEAPMSRPEGEDKRKRKRSRLVYLMRVFDRHTDAMLGHIGDISREGMMLVHEQPIPLGQDFDVWVEFPLEDGDRGRVPMEARSIWTRRDANPSFKNTGFWLKNPTEEAIASIQAMIDELALER